MSSKALLQLRSEFERLITQFVERPRRWRRTPPSAAAPSTRSASGCAAANAACASSSTGRRPSPADAWPPGSWRPSGGSSPSSRDARPGSLASLRGRGAPLRRPDQGVAREVCGAPFPGAGSRSRTSCARPRRRCPTGSSISRAPRPTGWSGGSGTAPARLRRRARSRASASGTCPSASMPRSRGGAADRGVRGGARRPPRRIARRRRAGRPCGRARLAVFSRRSKQTHRGRNVSTRRTDAAMDQLTLLDERDQDELGRLRAGVSTC